MKDIMRKHMNLQLFAEPAPGEGETGHSDVDNGGAGADQGKDTPRTFTQEDMDKLAAKVRSEERKKADDLISKARSEGERLARMSEEEKARHAAEQREADLAKRERDLSMRELRATARDILGEKALPTELLGALDYTSAETVQSSIESMEKAFRAAVQKGVEERMKGTTPEKRRSPSAEEAQAAALRKAFGLPERKNE